RTPVTGRGAVLGRLIGAAPLLPDLAGSGGRSGGSAVRSSQSAARSARSASPGRSVDGPRIPALRRHSVTGHGLAPLPTTAVGDAVHGACAASVSAFRLRGGVVPIWLRAASDESEREGGR